MTHVSDIRAEIAGLPPEDANAVLLGWLEWYLPKPDALDGPGWAGFSTRPQVRQVIFALARRDGGLVTREALLAYLETEAYPRVIDTLVAYARAAIREAGWPVRIETVWGQGYRLIRDKGFVYPWEGAA